ncbi:lactococcin 972 family bacteriocin [Streptomyces sp. NPDC058372]|uniref:lactococcin 972 family bacteriocin n=1 Tax=Streptomyces sp. NPDC058372 TaxID=3346464 RepID=UPI003666B620
MRLKRVLKSVAISSALVVAAATPAMATVVNVGGGTWDYGAGTATVWSDYYHKSKCHGSTSVGAEVDSDVDQRRQLVHHAGQGRALRQQELLQDRVLTS